MQRNEVIEQLYRTHADRLWHLATVILKDDEEAREVVSDVFLRFADGTLPLPCRNEEAYLGQVVRNRCLDRIDHLKARDRIERHLAVQTSAAQEPVDVWKQRVEDLVDYAQRTLTPQTWRVFRLRFDEHRSYRDIASALDISEVAVYKHLSQALIKLKQFAKEEEL